jgi:hypothetical protein
MLNLGVKMTDSEEYHAYNPDWRSYAEFLLLLDEVQLRLVAKKFAEGMIEKPELYYKILLIALSESIL